MRSYLRYSTSVNKGSCVIIKDYKIMELDKFIETTLASIQKGIKNANIKIAQEEGTKVRENGEMQYEMNANRSGERGKGISFDVAVTVVSEKNFDGQGKVSVVGISLGGGKSSTSSEQSISRIKFEVNPFNSIY